MASGSSDSWDQQRMLDALLGKPTYKGFSDMPQQAYTGSTPAQQQENLLYANNNDKVASRNNSQLLDDNFPPLSEEGPHIDVMATGESFVSGGSTWRDSPMGVLAADSQASASLQPPPQEQEQQQEERLLQTSDFFNRLDDNSFGLSDDLGSSFGSSIYSEMPTPSYSSSIPHQPPLLSGPAAYLSSPGVRSPSSSLRAGSYLSTSLRNSSSNTPRTRHASISSAVTNSVDGMLPGSVPKNMSHLSTDDRLKRKREFHNAVERRRRELIKLKIKELGTIIPPSFLNYDLSGKQVKPNKGIILHKTVEYLEYLLQVLEAQDRKKAQLARKLQELQDKEKNQRTTDIRGNEVSRNENMGKEEPVLSLGQISSQDNDDEYFSGKIIDTRARPQTSFTAEMDQEESISQWPTGIHDNTNKNENFNTINDDLRQFLSGDLIEAEDNAKLIFGEGETNPADYLLKFEP